MKIPANAERIQFRTANKNAPARIEPDFGDGFSPRQMRFGGGDERYTLALASRVQLTVETALDQPPQAGFSCSKVETPERREYTTVMQNQGECRAAVALFQEETGQVSFAEYKWKA